MLGNGDLSKMEVVVFTQIVRNPQLLAVSLMPNIETPSVVAKQRFDRESDVYSLPKYLHTICKQAIPHCIVSCWCIIGKCFIVYNLLISFCPALLPLYLLFVELKE